MACADSIVISRSQGQTKMASLICRNVLKSSKKLLPQTIAVRSFPSGYPQMKPDAGKRGTLSASVFVVFVAGFLACHVFGCFENAVVTFTQLYITARLF